MLKAWKTTFVFSVTLWNVKQLRMKIVTELELLEGHPRCDCGQNRQLNLDGESRWKLHFNKLSKFIEVLGDKKPNTGSSIITSKAFNSDSKSIQIVKFSWIDTEVSTIFYDNQITQLNVAPT